VSEAESAYRRSLAISESLWKANPESIHIGDVLARSLNNLGILLDRTSRLSDAELAFRLSIAISDSLWEVNPDNIDFGNDLALR